MMALFESATQRVKAGVRPWYERLPLRFRAHRIYWETLALLEDSQRWDADRLAEYQVLHLRKILEHCAAHVPYYRDLFRKAGFDPGAVRKLEDISALPTLDKEIVRSRLQELLASNIQPSERLYFTTGGTTAEPLGLYAPKEAGWRERAFMETQWARIGYRTTDLRAMLKGWVVNNRSRWRYDANEHSLIFSNYHMTPEMVRRYADVIKRRRVSFLHAYPSAAMNFARLLEESNTPPPRFKAILLGSESIYPGQRERIEGFFGCRVYSWYGHSEDTVLAGECEVSANYHIFPEYSFVEVLKEDGSAATEEGESGELVGTTLYNRVMPLLRYRTGDWAVVGPKNCACGRHYRLLSATQGRRQEVLVGKLDNLISFTALNMHSPVLDNVWQFQFHQREKGKAELRVVRKPSYSERDSRAILAAFGEKMGDTIDLHLTFADELSLTERGKFRLIVQNIPRVPDLAPELTA